MSAHPNPPRFSVQYIGLDGRPTAYSPRKKLGVRVWYGARFVEFEPRQYIPRETRESFQEWAAEERLLKKRAKERLKPRPKRWTLSEKAAEDAAMDVELDEDTTVEKMDRVYHLDPDTDVYDRKTGFVWRDRKLPKRLRVFGQSRPFRVVRIWAFVRNTNEDAYQLWARASTIPLSTWNGAREFARRLYDALVDELSTHAYLEARSFHAWTAYTLGQRAPTGLGDV